jgi:hypothetical protein
MMVAGCFLVWEICLCLSQHRLFLWFPGSSALFLNRKIINRCVGQAGDHYIGSRLRKANDIAATDKPQSSSKGITKWQNLKIA